MANGSSAGCPTLANMSFRDFQPERERLWLLEAACRHGVVYPQGGDIWLRQSPAVESRTGAPRHSVVSGRRRRVVHKFSCAVLISGRLFPWILVDRAVSARAELPVLANHLSSAPKRGLSMRLRDGFAALVLVVVASSTQPDEALGDCPDVDLGSTLPIYVSGSTTGANNNFAGFCGGGGSPDVTFQYTTPVEGTYTFHLPNWTFDPVISLRDGCTGLELVCHSPRVTAGLSAGRTVIIVVDGNQGNQSGDFSLQITGPTVTPTPTPTATPTPSVTATAPSCPGGPIGGCRTSSLSAKGSFQYKDVSSNDTKDQLQWKWSKGSMTTQGRVRRPADHDELPALHLRRRVDLILDSTIPAGRHVRASNPKPCWKDKPKGFDYKDKDSTADGISQLKLQEGLIAGKAQIQVKGKGTLLDDPTLPFGQPVTVQLHNAESGPLLGGRLQLPGPARTLPDRRPDSSRTKQTEWRTSTIEAPPRGAVARTAHRAV